MSVIEHNERKDFEKVSWKDTENGWTPLCIVPLGLNRLADPLGECRIINKFECALRIKGQSNKVEDIYRINVQSR